MEQQEDDLFGFDIDPAVLEEVESSFKFTKELRVLKEADLGLLNKPPDEAVPRGVKSPNAESVLTDGLVMGHETALMVPPVDTSVRKPKDGKVRRPPNSFILFSKEWRRKLATQYPEEKSSDISVRLGALWRSLVPQQRETFEKLARHEEAKHKEKYPDYFYNPHNARRQKSLHAAACKIKGIDLRGYKNISSANTQPTSLEITSAPSDSYGVVSGRQNTDNPLPAFEEAFIFCF